MRSLSASSGCFSFVAIHLHDAMSQDLPDIHFVGFDTSLCLVLFCIALCTFLWSFSFSLFIGSLTQPLSVPLMSRDQINQSRCTASQLSEFNKYLFRDVALMLV